MVMPTCSKAIFHLIPRPSISCRSSAPGANTLLGMQLFITSRAAGVRVPSGRTTRTSQGRAVIYLPYVDCVFPLNRRVDLIVVDIMRRGGGGVGARKDRPPGISPTRRALLRAEGGGACVSRRTRRAIYNREVAEDFGGAACYGLPCYGRRIAGDHLLWKAEISRFSRWSPAITSRLLCMAYVYGGHT
jgi:hypothetical protein